MFNKEVGVFSFLSNDNELPRLGDDNRNSSEVCVCVCVSITKVIETHIIIINYFKLPSGIL